jgi:capsular exopolysaccharide synthesis family protein
MMEGVGMANIPIMLRRHVWLVALMAAAGTMVGAGASYLVRQFSPLYRAEAAISVRSPNGQESDYERRVLLAGMVKSQSMVQMMLDPVLGRGIRETRWFRDSLHEDTAEAIKALAKSLDPVAQRQASSIVVSMTAGNPREATLIATQAAELFISQQTPPQRDEVGPKLAELTQRQGEIERDIRDQETTMQTLRQSAREKGIADPSTSPPMGTQSPNSSRLNELELRESEQTLDITQLQGKVENLKRLAEGAISSQVEHAVEQDPVIVSWIERLAMLQAQLAGQLTRLGEDHRVVRQTKEQIDEVQAALRQRKLEVAEQTRQANLSNAQDDLHVQEERLAQLQQLREQTQLRQKTQTDVKAQYDQVREKRDEQIAALNQIKTQIENLRALPAPLTTPELQLAGPAVEPAGMVLSRSLPLWALGGAVLGLITGLVVVTLSKTLDDLMRTPSDVRRFLNLPLLGVIPDASEDRAVSDIDPYHIVHDAPYSLLGEAYRRCRTNLDVSDRAAMKTLLIASGDARDGKTSLACNLAAAFAAKHENVLLIDANLRQPSLHLAFGRSGVQASGDQRRMGLTSILTGQCDYQAAIRTSRVAGLDLIYAGPPATNPAELLAGRRMKDLIENAAKWYDHVIIDSPPVLLVSDVKVLAGLVDATLLVFNAAATHRGAAQRTICELQDVGARLVGCVLFDVQALKGGYFRRQFKAYRNYLKPQLAANSA